MYRGAGILYVNEGKKGADILLARRRRSRIWSIPGGAARRGEADLWQTACRETQEEFGAVPVGRPLFTLSYPLGFFGFDWRTYGVEVAPRPDGNRFPDQGSPGFRAEFDAAAWFPVSRLPSRTHGLLYPAVWRLRGAVAQAARR